MSREPFIKPLNGFQKERVPYAASDAAFASPSPVDTPPSQREQTVHEWVENFKFGHEFADLCELLSDDSTHELARILQKRVRNLYGDDAYTHPEHLEKAYIQILDEGLLDELEAEAAENAERLSREEVAETLDTAEQYTPVPLASREEIAKLKKLASTKKGLAQLRREAIFSGHVETVPLSGTARRF